MNKKNEYLTYEFVLVNLSSIKPMDEDIVIEFARKTGNVITIEDHSIYFVHLLEILD